MVLLFFNFKFFVIAIIIIITVPLPFNKDNHSIYLMVFLYGLHIFKYFSNNSCSNRTWLLLLLWCCLFSAHHWIKLNQKASSPTHSGALFIQSVYSAFILSAHCALVFESGIRKIKIKETCYLLWRNSLSNEGGGYEARSYVYKAGLTRLGEDFFLKWHLCQVLTGRQWTKEGWLWAVTEKRAFQVEQACQTRGQWTCSLLAMSLTCLR